MPEYAAHADGERLREARLAAGLRLGDAARLLHLTTADYSGLETGRKVLAPGENVESVVLVLLAELAEKKKKESR